jgi:hypothetical protein
MNFPRFARFYATRDSVLYTRTPLITLLRVFLIVFPRGREEIGVATRVQRLNEHFQGYTNQLNALPLLLIFSGELELTLPARTRARRKTNLTK